MSKQTLSFEIVILEWDRERGVTDDGYSRYFAIPADRVGFGSDDNLVMAFHLLQEATASGRAKAVWRVNGEETPYFIEIKYNQKGFALLADWDGESIGWTSEYNDDYDVVGDLPAQFTAIERAMLRDGVGVVSDE